MGSSDASEIGTDRPRLPMWARVLISGVLAFHIMAILAAALAAPPASGLEREAADQFARYFELVDQGYAYRYYAPEPPPTPVVEATLRFADGRPERIVRLPDRETRPRLLYQRQLALANHLFVEFDAARNTPGEPPPAHWAPSYARHLGAVYGCASVVLSVKRHLIPDPARVREALADPAQGRYDLDAEENYTVSERIGEYPCNAS